MQHKKFGGQHIIPGNVIVRRRSPEESEKLTRRIQSKEKPGMKKSSDEDVPKDKP